MRERPARAEIGNDGGDMGVSEAEARGDVAVVFADIRAAMGMPFVNLIWRRLAESPAALRWTWEAMKPLYADGVIFSEAARLRDGQDLPRLPRLPRSALRAVGVDERGEAAIRATLAGYDHANPLNLIAFSAILTGLTDRESPTAAPVADAQSRAARATVPPPAPRLSLDEMGCNTVDLVRRVTMIGASRAACHVQVSLPRNLAHWPGFLSLYLATLRPLHDDGRLASAIESVLAAGAWRGERLACSLSATAPSDAIALAVREPIETLVPHAMGRMIPIVTLLQRILPEE